MLKVIVRNPLHGKFRWLENKQDNKRGLEKMARGNQREQRGRSIDHIVGFGKSCKDSNGWMFSWVKKNALFFLAQIIKAQFIFQNIPEIWDPCKDDGELHFCPYKGDLSEWRKWFFPKQRFWYQKSLSCRLSQRWDLKKKRFRLKLCILKNKLPFFQWNLFPSKLTLKAQQPLLSKYRLWLGASPAFSSRLHQQKWILGVTRVFQGLVWVSLLCPPLQRVRKIKSWHELNW